MYFQANEGTFSLYTEAHQKASNQSSFQEFRHLWSHSIAWSSIRALGQPFLFAKKKSLGKRKNVLRFQRIANQEINKSWKNKFALSAQSAQGINGCKSARDESSNLSNPTSQLRLAAPRMCFIFAKARWNGNTNSSYWVS